MKKKYTPMQANRRRQAVRHIASTQGKGLREANRTLSSHGGKKFAENRRKRLREEKLKTQPELL